MVDACAPSLLEAPAFLDLEASGFGRASYPIEVGCVLPDGSSFCSLIRPAPGWTHWDPAAEKVHHIPRETLQQHGREVHEVARTLNERLRGQTVYSDGWAHDYPWLATLYEEAEMVPSFKLDSLRTLLSEGEARAWQSTKQLVSRAMPGQRHRASADARLLQSTLMRLRHGQAA
ncbi:3'-5' exonuclease [Sphaerotilaceae bacterium SBD11-9]